MRITIEDLEALKELNDELEENHVETEKAMQEEIGVWSIIRHASVTNIHECRGKGNSDPRPDRQDRVPRRGLSGPGRHYCPLQRTCRTTSDVRTLTFCTIFRTNTRPTGS